ncbi:MAG: hypothetical protein HRT44_08420 [Bdellovibrionales bacterium]|nr:hypothetical protein [Bdellovibrionales bacterium]NQZ19264.1 hypothetical protein [Bdellovibrionales bacterium]
MTKQIRVFVFIFLTITAEAGDLLPHQMTTSAGTIHSNDLDLTAIDNQFLSIQPTEDGKFDSQFFFKKQAFKANPFLDVRISFAEGAYDFQIQKGKKWIHLGTIEAKKEWQRVKLDLPHKLSRYAKGKKLIKVRIIGKNNPSNARLDYMGFSLDQETVLNSN